MLNNSQFKDDNDKLSWYVGTGIVIKLYDKDYAAIENMIIFSNKGWLIHLKNESFNIGEFSI